MSASIVGENVWVEFPIYESSNRSIKKAMVSLATGGKFGSDAHSRTVITALQDLNFRFEDGDRVALTGHNGTGKTTLLRTLAGVYAPTRGVIRTRGKIASLLDVTMGLDMDANGFENIHLRGTLDGLSPSRIRDKVEEIADFSGLADFLRLPVRTYSSGMLLRLGFAISTSIDADILVMDEWLSVGDAEFQAKATKRLDILVGRASIVVIATHDAALVQKVCTREFSMQQGKIVGEYYINRPR